MSTSSPSRVKLSQWDALALESLKAYGWTNETILERVRTSQLPHDDSKFKFDYSNLVELAKSDTAVFEQAVTDGYQIKYNTIRGIQSWILLALKLEAEMDLEPGKEAIRIRLTEQETRRIGAVLSYGWSIQRGDQSSSAANERIPYKIVPIR